MLVTLFAAYLSLETPRARKWGQRKKESEHVPVKEKSTIDSSADRPQSGEKITMVSVHSCSGRRKVNCSIRILDSN